MIGGGYFTTIFPLIKNAELWFKSSTLEDGPHGGEVTVWSGSDYTEAYKEPFSSALALQEYGLQLDCQDRIFCRPNDSLVEGVGAYLTNREGEPDYIVVSVTPWPEHYECLLRRR
ncbi:hypothetical protein [Paenibacillus wynnii]|uniref:Uncharacterized protein n=1 Tax=Paenibacillus wynnii TaxID=268407 RepID=A0A098MDH6_9BACL|nr:hypothetical protein [Paenibacillus wynnii]KGE20625.1 hypothetical protein PWYN_15705 [Paenibacillus wynnii]